MASMLVACASLTGCGWFDSGSTPKTEAQRDFESKVQKLKDEGKSFAEIRATLKGEPLPKKRTSKTRAKHK
jgi:hypothetical protein